MAVVVVVEPFGIMSSGRDSQLTLWAMERRQVCRTSEFGSQRLGCTGFGSWFEVVVRFIAASDRFIGSLSLRASYTLASVGPIVSPV